MLGSPIVYLKGMRILMFQLSGFYYTTTLPLHLAEVAMAMSAANSPAPDGHNSLGFRV